jgi:phospholipid transport system substrate-binding protein
MSPSFAQRTRPDAAARWLPLVALAAALALAAPGHAAPPAGKAAPEQAAPGKAAPPAAPAAPAAGAAADAQQAVIKRLIGAVRYKRDAKALETFAGEAQGAFLAGAQWERASAAERAEFVELFHKMFAAIAFPRIRASFEKLETILYGAPKVSGDKASLQTTIVILHPVKKQEIVATYDLVKAAGGWKVVDVTVKGDKSMLTNIRDEQVQKLLAKGGWPHLLELMRKRVAKAGG